MLKDMIDNKLIEARGIVGFYRANTVNKDDIEIYDPADETASIGKFYTLRQQLDVGTGNAFLAMSDFIAPKESGVQDYIGAFAVSAGFKSDEMCKKFEADGDDYNIMLVKTLTDRLAEAFAEQLHVEVRKETWGYAPEEDLTPAQCLNV
jgi:5-methyltetrahydrofolate--homocysteine methyltransferase